jgi:hypothetical protein
MLADSGTERDTFLAVVYADADWLRAEFDAIVEANWDEPPARPGPSGRPVPGPARPDSPRRRARPLRRGRPVGPTPARERSPPVVRAPWSPVLTFEGGLVLLARGPGCGRGLRACR